MRWEAYVEHDEDVHSIKRKGTTEMKQSVCPQVFAVFAFVFVEYVSRALVENIYSFVLIFSECVTRLEFHIILSLIVKCDATAVG